MRIKAPTTLVPLALVTAAVSSATAQEPMQLQRLDSPIRFDGVVDDVAWQRIDPLPLTMYQPLFRGEPSVRTEIRVAYDDEYLYVSGKMYDNGRHERLVTSLQRDGLRNDDALVFQLDTFNDNENGVMFGTNPAGVRFDASIGNDGQGFFGGGMIPSWNTFWDAEVSQTDEGWFAEMRIPFSSLRFQDVGGRVVMGMKAYRQYASKSETVSFPETRTEWNNGLQRPSRYHDVMLAGVRKHNPIYITPYALSGLDRTPVLNRTGTAYDGDNDGQVEAGLDVKYGLTSNLTLDLTLNTDFAQVEADDQQVNLTRFSLFFPEKRQFFLERSGIFNFTLNDFGRVFHSRRIGIADDGSQVRILGGARLVGRAGHWDVGVINMQTEADGSAGRPSFNNGVYRLRRRVLNDRSSVGAIATTKLGDDGSYNVVYGADATIQLTGDTYMEINAAQSADDDRDFDFLNSTRFRFTVNRRSSQGLGYGTWITRSGNRFNPELGFIQRSNFTRAELMVNYGYFTGSESALRFIQPMVFGTIFWRNGELNQGVPAGGSAPRRIESAQIWNNYFFGFKSGAGGGLGLFYNFDDLQRGFNLSSDAGVPAGEHNWYSANLNLNSPPGNKLTFGGNARVGGFYDGSELTLGGGPNWVASPQLQLGGNYTFTRIRFSERDQTFQSHLARVRVQAALDTHLTGSAFVQYSSAADNVSANVRLRYHFSEGRDLFIVFNESLDTDRTPATIGLPRDPLSQRRTLIVKYSYTIVN